MTCAIDAQDAADARCFFGKSGQHRLLDAEIPEPARYADVGAESIDRGHRAFGGGLLAQPGHVFTKERRDLG